MSDAPAIRPHSPRQNRWAVTGLALLAIGSFGNAAIQKAGVIFQAAPISNENAVQSAPAPAPAPAMQVAAVQAPHVRTFAAAAPPRLEVPAPAAEAGPELQSAAPAAIDAAATAPSPDPPEVAPPDPAAAPLF